MAQTLFSNIRRALVAPKMELSSKPALLNILYIGNYFPYTVMKAIGKKLALHHKLTFASANPNKIARIMEMCQAIWSNRRSADVVLVDTYSTLNFWYAWISALMCRVLKIPYITYLHGGNLPVRLKTSPRMSKFVFDHSFANVAPSRYLQTAFEQNGFKTILIPNFIELEDYPFVQREGLRPRFLWVRSFQKIYNPEMTITVFAAIHKLYPDAQLCMVGADKDGSMEICKKMITDLHLENQVVFTGSLPRAQWIALAHNYDIFISTTHFDNTPVSVIEAMALGLPIISTSVGGVPFLIKHGTEGLLSPDNDVATMVENITALLKSPDLSRNISRDAREKATIFSWEKVEKQWLELLETIN